MSIELVTGHAGRNHVDSEDVGAFYAGVVGKGRYALDVGENLAVTMSDANTVRIGTGLFVMDGRYVRVKDAESVKVANGAQAAYRKDLVVCTYTRDPSNGNVEGVAVSVLQGKAAAKESDAKVPTFEKGDILNGDLKATVALAEVDLAGLTPKARLLLPNVASLKTLGESVSPIQIRGWKVLESEKTSGSPGVLNQKIYMAYEGTDSSWMYIPIRQAWCTVEAITFDSGGIRLSVNPTTDSSNIRVTLLALKLGR